MAIIVIASIILGVWQTFERTNPLDIRTVTILSVGGTEPGDNATDFILESLNGTDIRLNAFENKKNLILHFWYKESNELTNLQTVRNFYGDRVEILGINSDANISNIRRIATTVCIANRAQETSVSCENINFPILPDPESEVKQAYSVSILPTTYFVDAKGMIIDKKEGPLAERELNEKIKNLLAVR